VRHADEGKVIQVNLFRY